MGMSASQARLLSITSRLTNNEFRAQTITNSKLRLATQSQEASQKYMDALSSKKLVYGIYDANGDKTYTPLTANVLLSYGELKNQYALVNTSGQILLSGSDIKTYMQSYDYNDYMIRNGVGLLTVTNDEYTDQLQAILGADWAEYLYDTDYTTVAAVMATMTAYLNNINGAASKVKNVFNATDLASVSNASGYQNLVDKISYNPSGALEDVSDYYNLSGMLGKYLNTISNPPAWNLGARPSDFSEIPPVPDLFASAQTLLSPQCWDGTGINDLWAGTSSYTPNDDQIWHMEHVLAQYVFSSPTDVINIEGETITNTTSPSDAWSMSGGGGNGSDPMLVRNVLNKSENSNLKHDLQVLFYQVCKFIDDNNIVAGLSSGTITDNGAIPPLGATKPEIANAIGQEYKELVGDLLTAVATDIIDGCTFHVDSFSYTVDDYKGRPQSSVNSFVAAYNNALNAFKSTPEYAEWENRKNAREEEQAAWDKRLADFKTTVTNWLNSFDELANKIQEAINALGNPTKQVPDTNDAKYQWYTNLWNRMGGGAKIGTTDNLDTSNFVELDENLMNNAEWLEFAFEHGILTLEQAVFFEDGSEKYPDMGQYDWVSKAYTNAVDIVSQDDEIAIAIAEVEYKNTITEIENKDKKYDQDLKKLDTEHNALQTEYESVKEVVSKNVERSFKAFS